MIEHQSFFYPMEFPDTPEGRRQYRDQINSELKVAIAAALGMAIVGVIGIAAIVCGT